MNLLITPIPILKDNYVWIVIHPQKKYALIVDPGEARPVLDYLKQHQLALLGILIIHHHWDHTNGVVELTKIYDVPVFGKSSAPYITRRVCENDTVIINDFLPHYSVIDIPGHTLDHVAYYTRGTLFCGDTLFAGGCGRLFEGKAEELYTSLQKMAALPDETKIYCAHEYTLNNLKFAQTIEPDNLKINERINKVRKLLDNQHPSLPSTLKEEKESNPFLRCHSPSLIAHLEKHLGRFLQDSIEIFSELRKLKDQF